MYSNTWSGLVATKFFKNPFLHHRNISSPHFLPCYMEILSLNKSSVLTPFIENDNAFYKNMGSIKLTNFKNNINLVDRFTFLA